MVCMLCVGYVIAASVGLRAGFEEADGSEGSSSEVNVCNVQATNFVINQHENADLHTVADETSLEGPGSELRHHQECKKHRNGTSAGGASKQQKWKRVYEERVVEVRKKVSIAQGELEWSCLLYTSPSPRDLSTSRMPSSA